MNPTLRTTDSHPEAMADVQGGCDVSLTRGIILYRERGGTAGGRIDDIGVGLVIEGRFAAESTVVDLGSGRTRRLDLSGEVVILDWAYEPTVEHVRKLIRSEESVLTSYCFDLALRVLRRAGFGPVTRSTFLRIGFRDICRDLDFHDGAAVRLATDTASLYRVHLDPDSVALVVRTSNAARDAHLESALREFYPDTTLLRAAAHGPLGAMEYQLRFPLPATLAEARDILGELRAGLGHLIARFEPQRHRTVSTMLQTFGIRDVLERVDGGRETAQRQHAPVAVPRPVPGVTRIH